MAEGRVAEAVGAFAREGTIYKGQGKTLDRTYLHHSRHSRQASSYVALTCQRESAVIFAATETARDVAQLARQMSRGEVRLASAAWATRAELAGPRRRRSGSRPTPGGARRAAGKGGLLAGGSARQERAQAERAAQAVGPVVGPAVARVGEAEGAAGAGYRAGVEAVRRAEQVGAPRLSERAQGALGAVAQQTTGEGGSLEGAQSGRQDRR